MVTTGKKRVGWNRWLIVLIVVAGALGALAYLALSALGFGKYTACASILIARSEREFMADYRNGSTREREYHVYRARQEQNLLSRLVITKALRDRPEFVKYFKGVDDPVAWLRHRLSVSFPGNAELMQVSLTLADKEKAKALVNAVVDAYISEVVDRESEQKRHRFSEVDGAVVETDQDIRNKRQELIGLGKELGSLDPDILKERQKHASEKINALSQQLGPLQTKRRVFKRDLVVQKALLADAKADSRVAIVKEIERLETSIAVTIQQEWDLKQQVQRAHEEAYKIGRSIVDLEMLRAEFQDLEAVRSKRTAIREELRIELHAAPRVRVYERAE